MTKTTSVSTATTDDKTDAYTALTHSATNFLKSLTRVELSVDGHRGSSRTLGAICSRDCEGRTRFLELAEALYKRLPIDAPHRHAPLSEATQSRAGY